jgi:MtN3 and saliva related transmembrane protein
MNLSVPEFVGYCAAILTTVSFVPQVWHTFRSRDVNGISLGMYVAFAIGVFLWLVYGTMLGAWPIVIANAVTLALALAILAMKLRWGARPPRQ